MIFKSVSLPPISFSHSVLSVLLCRGNADILLSQVFISMYFFLLYTWYCSVQIVLFLACALSFFSWCKYATIYSSSPRWWIFWLFVIFSYYKECFTESPWTWVKMFKKKFTEKTIIEVELLDQRVYEFAFGWKHLK